MATDETPVDGMVFGHTAHRWARMGAADRAQARREYEEARGLTPGDGPDADLLVVLRRRAAAKQREADAAARALATLQGEIEARRRARAGVTEVVGDTVEDLRREVARCEALVVQSEKTLQRRVDLVGPGEVGHGALLDSLREDLARKEADADRAREILRVAEENGIDEGQAVEPQAVEVAP